MPSIKNKIECATVYVDKNRRTDLILKCYFCNRDFLHWTRFVQHLEARHINLERAYLRANWDEKGRGCAIEELQHTEMVLIAEEESAPLESSQDAEEESGNLQITQDTDFEETQKPSEEDEEPQNVEQHLEAPDYYELEMLDECRKKSIKEDPDANEINEDDFEDECETLEEDKEIKLPHINETSSHGTDIAAYESECSDTNSEKKERKKYAARAFYNLRKTPPEIMLDFIDIIRLQPCQWDRNSPDYEDKDKRDESAELISLELEEHWNFKITPSMARISVLQLCRWFEGEYIRLLHNKKLHLPHSSAHPDYFEKLLEFLPHKHLKLHTCDECQRTFKSEPQLLSHKHMEHKAELPFGCQYCARRFQHISKLKLHENRHTRERLFHCNLCSYSCVAKTDFQLHRITHTDIRAYVCHLCNASYKSSTSLNVHKRTHGPPKLKCKYCTKLFHENYRLKRHVLKHETNDDSTTAERSRPKLKCAHCNKKFARHDTLERHKKMHDMLKDEVDNKEELDELIVNIQNELCEKDDLEIFSCSICKLDFFTFNALHKHSVKMHKMELY